MVADNPLRDGIECVYDVCVFISCGNRNSREER